MKRTSLHNAALTAVAFVAFSLGSASLSGETQRSVQLQASDENGVPQGINPRQWSTASGTAQIVAQENGEDVIVLRAEGLVPDGIYTIWWVTPRIIGMDMGPGGGLPQNTFTANHEGRAQARLTVPSDNTYRMMVVAYHADHRLYGEEPGEMGEVTFEHIKGTWPGS